MEAAVARRVDLRVAMEEKEVVRAVVRDSFILMGWGDWELV